MFAVFQRARKSAGVAISIASAIFLSACTIDTSNGGGQRINPSKPVPVALLVPGGSGSSTDTVLASSLENAARLAMSELSGVTIDLRVYNTAGNPDQAARMAVQAVNDGAKILLGPVFAKNANAAGLAVARRNVNVLSFSNNPSIAGGNVFVLGNTFNNTANRLVSYAKTQGKGRIMVVHGDDGAETDGSRAIQNAIAAKGATLAGVRGFELSQNGIVNAIPGISREVKSSGAQSLFLTSGTSGALPFLAGLLPENGVAAGSVQLIGLQRWDIPANALSLPGLQGGWFAIPDPALNNQFRTRYQAKYGAPPHPIAGLAYDGIAAIGALAKSGKANALTSTALTQAQGFAGVNGIFRLRGDGTNERGLAVAQIQNNQVVVIDPAPRSFAGAGF
ncbi:penicillin-binding protein activator [Aliiroseovarius crassostreae]|uniref:penicillin-binding protein activator n=1 Tax=Aliiroseovarius crassostreae TaxID=154981 RepID=UPI00220E4254|nr:penicillin-binding protein activator [Aliiroseovarius crassostreae]UWQ04083.1 penicillin-binding protein activator [Aliiroseovarius crassostreae]